MFMKMGEQWPIRQFTPLRIIGSVGEPLNPEAFEWYYHVIGKDKVPIRHLVADRDRYAYDNHDDWGTNAPGLCRQTYSWCGSRCSR